MSSTRFLKTRDRLTEQNQTFGKKGVKKHPLYEDTLTFTREPSSDFSLNALCSALEDAYRTALRVLQNVQVGKFEMETENLTPTPEEKFVLADAFGNGYFFEAQDDVFVITSIGLDKSSFDKNGVVATGTIARRGPEGLLPLDQIILRFRMQMFHKEWCGVQAAFAAAFAKIGYRHPLADRIDHYNRLQENRQRLATSSSALPAENLSFVYPENKPLPDWKTLITTLANAFDAISASEPLDKKILASNGSEDHDSDFVLANSKGQGWQFIHDWIDPKYQGSSGNPVQIESVGLPEAQIRCDQIFSFSGDFYLPPARMDYVVSTVLNFQIRAEAKAFSGMETILEEALREIGYTKVS